MDARLVEGAGAETAVIHGREHLHITDRVQAKALRNALVTTRSSFA